MHYTITIINGYPQFDGSHLFTHKIGHMWCNNNTISNPSTIPFKKRWWILILSPDVTLNKKFGLPLARNMLNTEYLADRLCKPDLEDRAPLGVKNASMVVLRPTFLLHQLVADCM